MGSGARSASKSDPGPRIATHSIDELIVCPTRVMVGSRSGSNSKPIYTQTPGLNVMALYKSVFKVPIVDFARACCSSALEIKKSFRILSA
jgi:hypothetical protein